jgi:hypothetical protein
MRKNGKKSLERDKKLWNSRGKSSGKAAEKKSQKKIKKVVDIIHCI